MNETEQVQKLRGELAAVRSRLADIGALARKNHRDYRLGYTFQAIEQHCNIALDRVNDIHTRAYDFVQLLLPGVDDV